MIYVALLRGVNVGGNNKVVMPELKRAFETIGFTNVVTYINSGNVVFADQQHSLSVLEEMIEAAIVESFRFSVKAIVRDLPTIRSLTSVIPEKWVNNDSQKTDVLFLWKDIDSPDIVKTLSIKEDLETLKYTPGALIWNIGRNDVNKSAMLRIIGRPLYKQMTIRNVNTVRRLKLMMEAIEAPK